MPDVRTPFNNADEKQTLLDFLEYLREAMIRKVDGLSDADLRKELVPSGTSLLWLLKHLTRVEAGWFQFAVTGGGEVPTGDLEPDDTKGSVIAGYRAAIARSNQIVAGIDDLDTLSLRASSAPEPMSVRWVLVHMIEETARHAGHADILREQIDGEIGR
jgi:uncharacterized damage-inducible protein DinB